VQQRNVIVAQRHRKMRAPLRFDTPDVASRELSLAAMATSFAFELEQMAALLQAALEDVEGKALVKDPGNPKYPILARSLRARHANLQKTISSLKTAA
jgi:hypothetical protein